MILKVLNLTAKEARKNWYTNTKPRNSCQNNNACHARVKRLKGFSHDTTVGPTVGWRIDYPTRNWMAQVDGIMKNVKLYVSISRQSLGC